VIPALQAIAGKLNLQKRIDKFQTHWREWDDSTSCMWVGYCPEGEKRAASGSCGCQYFSFEKYCQLFDQIEQVHSNGSANNSNIDSDSTYSNDRTTNITHNDDDNNNNNNNNNNKEMLEEALLLLTREMMYKLIGCNKNFGFDGFTYDANGTPLGEEYLTINFPLKSGIVQTVFLSEIEKFKIL
jgi:hypothetical protein